MRLNLLDNGWGKVAELTLSERNILSLLTKLYTEGSKCQIENNDVLVDGEKSTGYTYFSVKAEPDDVHYGGENAKRRGIDHAGKMHPITEVMINFLEQLRSGTYEKDNYGQLVFYIPTKESEEAHGS